MNCVSWTGPGLAVAGGLVFQDRVTLRAPHDCTVSGKASSSRVEEDAAIIRQAARGCVARPGGRVKATQGRIGAACLPVTREQTG